MVVYNFRKGVFSFPFTGTGKQIIRDFCPVMVVPVQLMQGGFKDSRSDNGVLVPENCSFLGGGARGEKEHSLDFLPCIL